MVNVTFNSGNSLDLSSNKKGYSDVKNINSGINGNTSSLSMKSTSSYSNSNAGNIEEYDISGSVSEINVGDTGKISSSALDLSKITNNHYDAANGKFMDEQYILKDYWNGDFEYRIEEDGVVYLSKDGVPMGRTHIDFIKIDTDAVNDSNSKNIVNPNNTNSNSSYSSINTGTNTSGYMSTSAIRNTNSNSSYRSIYTGTNTSGYMSTSATRNTNHSYHSIYTGTNATHNKV